MKTHYPTTTSREFQALSTTTTPLSPDRAKALSIQNHIQENVESNSNEHNSSNLEFTSSKNKNTSGQKVSSDISAKFQSADSSRANTEGFWFVPFSKNPRFVGRDVELRNAEELLFAGCQPSRVALVGLGGAGKTQIALELVHRIRDKHKDCSVMWIPATNMESLHQAYRNVAQQLSIPGCEEDTADVKRLVQDFLSKDSTGQWLLVFDNADDIEMWTARSDSERVSGRLIEYLPRSKQGCIIFTTRDRKTAVKLAHQNVLGVTEMDEEVAARLLQTCLVDHTLVNNQQVTTTLLKELTYLPLAIVQAAAYINENSITVMDYLSLLTDQEEEVIDLLSEEFEDDGRYHNTSNPVATTWLISFEQIRRQNSLAANCLSLMACIDPRGIPQTLLPIGWSRKKEIDAIGMLSAYSFISRRSADLVFDLHRLVHLATRNWLRKEGLLTHWSKMAIARLEEVFPDNHYQNRTTWRMYLPHAHYALNSDLVQKDDDSRINVEWRFGMCLFSDGRYIEAEISFVQVMETRKRVLGAEHPDTLTSMANLASAYRNQGRWKEAEELEVQVIEISSRVLGQEHPDTLTSMANLASTFWNQGRWKEAEELEVQMVETSSRVLGQEHPDTLTSMANLASTYRNQGRWKEAEELFVQVKETSSRVLGQEHPDTLTSMANLASTFSNQGRWTEAEALEAQVMKTRNTVLGPGHPDTLTSMANLASTYGNQGQWIEAETLEVQVMETRKTVLGVEHPDTLMSMANLASTFWKQGRWKEAEVLELQVMETRKIVLGVEHPDTLTSMNNLAFTWKQLGLEVAASELLLECVKERTRILGTNHPGTLSSSAALLTWQRERDQGPVPEPTKV